MPGIDKQPWRPVAGIRARPEQRLPVVRPGRQSRRRAGACRKAGESGRRDHLSSICPPLPLPDDGPFEVIL
jgi:hypothetical protein